MLRDYQKTAAYDISTALTQVASVCFQLPTGGGKTHIAADLIRRWNGRGKRVWFVCHRREIVQQAAKSLHDLGIRHGFVASGRDMEADAQIKICSVDTLRHRFSKLQKPDIIVWDECHHAAAKSWAALRKKFSESKHLGLTATPLRLDGKGLDDHFDRMISGPSVGALIDRGFLSNYRVFAPTIPDLRKIKMRGGDYERGDLSSRMAKPSLIGDVVEHYRKHADNARAIVFCVSVAASIATVNKFKAAGIPAAHVDGTTPGATRDARIADLREGRIRVLSNVEVFTEGFDLPAIDSVILLRPTKSYALFMQMIGRGLRAAKDKAPTVILDHSGLVYEHGMPSDEINWSLDGVERSVAVRTGAARLRRCPECSAVHGWADNCPECGHAYIAGDRAIEEEYGELREVPWRGAAPHGYETIAAFAKRIGVGETTAHRYFKRGLPHNEDGFVHIDDATKWASSVLPLSRQKSIDTSGPADNAYESRTKFAKRIGAITRTIRKLVIEGMPHDAATGWIYIQPALEWLKGSAATKYAARRSTSDRTTAPLTDGTETLKAFAKRIGVTSVTIAAWRAKGLPHEELTGRILVDDALKWVDANFKKTLAFRIKAARQLPVGFISKSEFSRVCGLPPGTIGYFARSGMPHDKSSGYIEQEAALMWVRQNKGHLLRAAI